MAKAKTKIDPYDVLGLDKNASDKQVKDSYRRKAMKSHPDSGGDAREFSLVSQAWAMIGDPDKRAEYDATGGIKSDVDYENMAIELICEAFETTIEDHDHRIDLIAACRKFVDVAINKTLSQIRTDISTTKHMIKSYAEYSRNLVVKHHNMPIIENLIASKIKEAEGIQKTAELSIGKMEQVRAFAYKILDQYEYTRPTPVNQGPPLFGNEWTAFKFDAAPYSGRNY